MLESFWKGVDMALLVIGFFSTMLTPVLMFWFLVYLAFLIPRLFRLAKAWYKTWKLKRVVEKLQEQRRTEAKP